MGPLNIVFLLLRYYTFVALGVLAWIAFWEGDDMEKCGHMVLLLPYMVWHKLTNSYLSGILIRSWHVQPLVLFALANIIVIARVYAMWDKDKRILALLRYVVFSLCSDSCVISADLVLSIYSCLYCAQIAVQAYVPRNLKPLHLPPGIKACGPWVIQLQAILNPLTTLCSVVLSWTMHTSYIVRADHQLDHSHSTNGS